MSTDCQGSCSNKLQCLRESTAQDEQLTWLKVYINTRFPCDKKNLVTDLHEFWPYKEMLSIESGLITCGIRIIVPRKMRPEMLQYIHEGHKGKEHCLLRAKNAVFWPKIMTSTAHREIYDLQGVWKGLATHRSYSETTPFPWHTLVTDLFYWKRMDFLIVADVFSKYILVRKLPSPTSTAVCIELSYYCH